MLELIPSLGARKNLRVLCVGAHCDDIEIGCGATLLRLAATVRLDATWLTLCSTPQREAEVRASAALFLKAARTQQVLVYDFRDGFLPAQWAAAKEAFESLRRLPDPDLVLTHEPGDRHQDHRIVSELTWNTFRNHLILEYEIPKYDGGLGQPNLYVPVSRVLAERKARHLLAAYTSQKRKRWFSAETFLALMRIRGVECNARDGYAEAFHARKLVL
jgi:LmbE family N-acetylglucosaminyl deacetylase